MRYARMRAGDGGARSRTGSDVMPRYALASHVFACLDGDQVVLLDLKQDRYFSFDSAKSRGLHAIVAGWPVQPGEETAEVAASARIAESLLERGLLVRPECPTGSPSPALPKAKNELLPDDYLESPSRRLGHLGAFVAATAIATLMLRVRSLERAVHRVRRRKARRQPQSVTFDAERTRELMTVFADLRPFLFSSRDQCLFESLVLIEFLALYGVFPSWVFGVRARPFAAHCWVQQESVVLNDTLEHLGRYTPIMAV
jgi:hypothetical protein